MRHVHAVLTVVVVIGIPHRRCLTRTAIHRPRLLTAHSFLLDVDDVMQQAEEVAERVRLLGRQGLRQVQLYDAAGIRDVSDMLLVEPLDSLFCFDPFVLSPDMFIRTVRNRHTTQA